jgi:hypothetical protein
VTSPFRAIAAVAAGALGFSGLALVTTATPAHAADPAGALGNVVINEVSSNGFTYRGTANTDFIELYNKGTTVIDLTGYKLIDNGAVSGATVLDGAIAPGGYAAFVPPAFGLGSADQVRLFAPDGTTLIDSVTPDGTNWTAHQAPSTARTPDGTGAFVTTTNPTPGGPNSLGDTATRAAYASIKINEFDTQPTDMIELYNAGSTTVNLAGFVISDGTAPVVSTADKLTLGNVDLAPGAYLAISPDTPASNPTGVVATYLPTAGFGLNKTDAVWLFAPDGTTLDVADDGDGTNHAGGSDAAAYGRTGPGFGLWKSEPAPTAGAVNSFTTTTPPATPTLDPNWDDVEINEVSSLNTGQYNAPFSDAVELYNKGANPVSIEGWYQIDSGAAANAVALTLADLKVWNGTALVAATSMTIPSHGYVVFSSKAGLSGEGDGVKVYGPGTDPASRQLIDSVTYANGFAGISDTADQGAASYAATTPGGDTFQPVTFQTLAQDNAPAIAAGLPVPQNVKINELSAASSTVELKNLGTTAVDLSGWTLKTGAGTAYTVPASTSLAAGALYTASSVTLPTPGTLTLVKAIGTTSDTFSWTEDGNASYSRCEFGAAAAMVETPQATFGAENACPQVGTETWPGPTTVTTVDDVATIGDADGNGDGDASGAVFDPTDPSILWVVQNKNTLHKLTKVNGKYVDVAGWEEGKKLHFASGTGAVDSEGLTIAPDGTIYVTSERDNNNNGVSSNKIERYDLTGVTAATTDLTAVSEWDVNSFITTGVNLGLEGITYVPDSFLVDAGWKVDGSAYTAAAYPTAGLYVTAVEETGALHFFSLTPGSAPVEVKVEKSGFPFTMDVTFDADRKALWALCDDSCGGAYNLLTVTDGDFTVAHSLARPAGMPNLNNEGMAIKPRSTAVDNKVEVVWTDDGDTGGYSLREGYLWASYPALGTSGAPAIAGSGAVGSALTAGAGNLAFTPAATTTYQWFVGSTPVGQGPVPFGQVGSYSPTAADLGSAVTLRATGTAAGYDATTVASASVIVVKGDLGVSGSLVAGTTAKVGVKLTPTSTLAFTPDASVTYQWIVGGSAIGTPSTTLAPYTPSAAQAAKQILVRAVATRAGYTDKVVNSTSLTIAAATAAKPPVATPPTKAQQAVTKAEAKVKKTTATISSLKSQIKAAKKAHKPVKAKRLAKKLTAAKKQLKRQKAALAKAKKAVRK